MLNTAEMRGLYPCLSEGQARRLAVMSEIYPWWVISPVVGFPQVHLYHAVYLLSTPQVQVHAATLGRLADEIDGFLDFARMMGWQNVVREWS